MYNKLFTKILDSSIWLESTPTRIVWLTFIAVMDEKGFASFAAIGNVANRARVTLDEAKEAIRVLESPDNESSDPDNEGRRLERVPGGWMVINAEKHRELVTRAIRQAQTAERVRRHRALKRTSNASVTPSEALSGSVTEEETEERNQLISNAHVISIPPKVPMNGNGHRAHTSSLELDEISERAGRLVERFGEAYTEKLNGARYRQRPNLDWVEACELCKLWDDTRLDKLVLCFLATDDPWICGTDKGFQIFAKKASWVDQRLAAWEAERRTAVS